MSSFLTVATTVWGVVMAVAPMLQIRLIVRSKDSSNVSLGWMTVLLIGYILWFSYGIAFNTVPLIIANSCATIVGAALIVTVLIYRKPRPAEVAVSEADSAPDVITDSAHEKAAATKFS